MPLEPGQALLQYRIVDKLGEGGMGVVWRAVDTTLDREVALKVLPDSLASDPERLARFDREARLLASLSHPNIAEIYGLHAAGETRFIAMELVAGEDLAQRLARGPLAQREVLEIGKQIARALEAAHEQGVIHRDLKPANIKLGADGRVKILDFGLAKAFQPDPASGEPDASMSPTLTSLGTRAGMILGTAAYMAPEQARGQAIDKRADIWALGCVLFEMLTGRSTFEGETISDTLAAVLKSEPDFEVLPEQTDPTLRLLIERCLEKDVRQRLRDVGEVRISIERLLSGEDSVIAAAGGTFAATISAHTGEKSGRGWLAVAAPLVLVAAIAGAAGWWSRPLPAAPDTIVRRFEIGAPGLRVSFSRAPVLSSNGRRLAYVAEDRIWIRDIDQLEPRGVPASEGARNVMFSPDGKHVGWQADGKIWRAAVSGGAKTAVCDAPQGIVATTWGPGERIILTPDVGPLYEVSARGGDPQALLEPLEGQDEDFHAPSFLPDGRGLIYTLHRLGQAVPDTIEVLVDGQRKTVLQIEGHWLAPVLVSADGYMVYRREGGNDGLWAAPFSLERLELTGEPILVDPLGDFPSVSADGSMLYFSGSGLRERQLVWVDRQGRETGTIGQPHVAMAVPAVSPEGSRVAVSADSGGSRDIWVYDAVRGSRTRLTFDSESDWAPAWYPDGQRVAFTRTFGSEGRIHAVRADGSGEPIELAQGELPHVSPEGRFVVFERNFPKTDDDLFFVGVEGGSAPTLFLETPLGEEHVQVSPNGDYLAYTSNDSGHDEIYLKRFPSGEGRWQVSVDGGDWVRWNPAGGELFYLHDERLMVVDVEFDGAPRLGTPRELFSLQLGGLLSQIPRPFDVAPDGNRFVMQRSVEDETGEPSLVFVENWVQALR
ncbi:MAG: serine/threonine-protein kinase [Acidobacteriota bacterium]|nr:MAG: serine/threonine-protein kinase [Acidobacteriota bacterium]